MKYNLICFGYNPWSDFWKRNQTIVKYLSLQDFVNKSLFLNPNIWLADSLKNPKKELAMLRRAYWNGAIPYNVNKKIRVFTPLYFPKLSKVTNLLTEKIINGYSQKPYILLINKPMKIDLALSDLINKASLTIFDWSDDFAQFAEGNESIEDVQYNIDQIISRSDMVFAVNDLLHKRALKLNLNSYCVRNATNMAMFSSEKITKLKAKSKVIIGYAGWLVEDRLDTELIHYCATELQDFNFVFIGPKVSKDPLNISNGPSNIHYEKPVAYEYLGGVLSQFDVCIIPNKVNEHTKGNDPIKIYDYLYLGKPVVTTNTAGVAEFKEVISIVNNKEDFKEAILNAIKNDHPNVKEKREKIGQKYSWVKKIESITIYIRAGLKIE